MKKKMIFVGVLLAVQFVAIGFLIYRYERVLLAGTEVRFRCRAYDPYDAFRGRYLRTSVRESTSNIHQSVIDAERKDRDRCVVRLEPHTNGLWRVAEAAMEGTSEGVWVSPKSAFVNGTNTVNVVFPSQLFLNENIASTADEILRKRTDDAVAVYRAYDGNIILVDIEIDGESIIEISKKPKENENK